MSATTAVLPGQPHDDAGPVFREAWEAHAFGLALLLHQRGVFTWTEWAAALTQEIKAAQNHGDPDLGDTYYLHWVHALQRLVTAKGVSTADDIEGMTKDWLKSARETPHGQPIVLSRRR
jgi:nitrile hydratase accessory protein